MTVIQGKAQGANQVQGGSSAQALPVFQCTSGATSTTWRSGTSPSFFVPSIFMALVSIRNGMGTIANLCEILIYIRESEKLNRRHGHFRMDMIYFPGLR